MLSSLYFWRPWELKKKKKKEISVLQLFTILKWQGCQRWGLTAACERHSKELKYVLPRVMVFSVCGIEWFTRGLKEGYAVGWGEAWAYYSFT